MPYVFDGPDTGEAHITLSLGDRAALCGAESRSSVGWGKERAFPFNSGTCQECHRIRYARENRLSDRREPW